MIFSIFTSLVLMASALFIDLDMIVKDMIQMLSDFDENMEVGIRSTCGMLDMAVSMERYHASIVGSQEFVLIKGVLPSEYYTKKISHEVH